MSRAIVLSMLSTKAPQKHEITYKMKLNYYLQTHISGPNFLHKFKYIRVIHFKCNCFLSILLKINSKAIYLYSIILKRSNSSILKRRSDRFLDNSSKEFLWRDRNPWFIVSQISVSKNNSLASKFIKV